MLLFFDSFSLDFFYFMGRVLGGITPVRLSALLIDPRAELLFMLSLGDSLPESRASYFNLSADRLLVFYFRSAPYLADSGICTPLGWLGCATNRAYFGCTGILGLTRFRAEWKKSGSWFAFRALMETNKGCLSCSFLCDKATFPSGGSCKALILGIGS